MAKHADQSRSRESETESNVDLSESSIYGNAQTDVDTDDVATAAQLDRLEAITGGADDPPVFTGKLGRKFDALDAGIDEELDALEVDLTQEGDSIVAQDSSGPVADDVAEEQIAAFTEVGPMSEDRGGESVEPGREDTSETLRRHRPHSDTGDDMDDIEGGNIDPPLDEDLEIDDPENEGETKA